MNYKGQSFGCSCNVCDATTPKNDPTGTGKLRSRQRTLLAHRWRKFRVLVRQGIVDQDLLGMTTRGLLANPVPMIAQSSSKIQGFQRWFDYLLQTVVLEGDGSFLRPMIRDAYDKGATFGRANVRQPIQYPHAQDREDALFQLAVVELQGIVEAVSQQGVRAVSQALLSATSPMSFVRGIWRAIDKVGVTRSNAMIDVMVVKTFNEAALDIYETAKVKRVGVVPETAPSAKLGDATRRSGPGSRSSRKSSPSRSTIGRIRRAERALERLGRVNVRTAGDDKVCQICEDIAEGGPYEIDTARSLIPAHPRCRCAFVPADDARFASDDHKQMELTT